MKNSDRICFQRSYRGKTFKRSFKSEERIKGEQWLSFLVAAIQTAKINEEPLEWVEKFVEELNEAIPRNGPWRKAKFKIPVVTEVGGVPYKLGSELVVRGIEVAELHKTPSPKMMYLLK
ncbi:MAG: hypothetical protein GY861_20795 [bacterium]|nr:hypothetical protein [bacterium]